MKVIKNMIRYILDLLLTGVAIILMVALAMFFRRDSSISAWDAFAGIVKGVFHSFLSIDQIQIQFGETMRVSKFLDLFQERYYYSLVILAGALFTTFLAALLLELLNYFSPRWLKHIYREVAFIIQSIPDVLLIFSIQLGSIWFYQRTEVLLFDPFTGFEKIYTLPILTLSILPVVMLFQMIDLSVSEEEDKLYVTFAYAKGFSKREVFFKHILRNTVLTMFANLQYLFWFMISNLLIMEILFNMDGLMRFIRFLLGDPFLLVISLILLFLPFYFIDTIGKSFVKRIAGGGQS